MNWIAEECGLIALDRMTDELNYQADDEQRQSPRPTEEEKRKRHDDHRDANRMRQPVQRMPMPGFVIVDE